MTCPICNGVGILRIDYKRERCCELAACTCERGQWFRVKHQLKAWAAVNGYPTGTVCRRLEDVYTAKAILELPETVEDAPPLADAFEFELVKVTVGA